MKTSIATVSISGDLREKLAAIAAAGFDGVEIFETDFLTFDGTPRDVGQMVRDHGLAITVYQPFRDFEGMPDAQRIATFDRAERKFDLMQELGTDLMLICSNVSPAALGGIDRAAADFHELGSSARRKRGIKVGYEALAWGRFVNDHRDAWEIVRRADHPNIGLIVDSFHTLARGISPDSIRAVPKDKIFLVQLADAPAVNMDFLSWSRHLRMMPGQGDLPVVDFMRAVVATGYDDVISIEVFNDQFRGGSPRSVSVDGRRSLIYLMEQVRAKEPGVAAKDVALPPRTEVEGVEFIEFAANESEAEELAALLRTMGFQEVRPASQQGRHPVPAGQHQYRHQYRARRTGAFVLCDARHVGLCRRAPRQRCAGNGRAGARARCAAFRAATGARRDRDSRHSRCRRRRSVFHRCVGTAAAYLGRRVRAVGGEWLGWCRFDGFRPCRPDHELHRDADVDPVLHVDFQCRQKPDGGYRRSGGLVRSQVIENASGALRLTLNGAENRNTLAGHFLAGTFGSTVQHLAFATDDIFATAVAMRQAGFSIWRSRRITSTISRRAFSCRTISSQRWQANDILYDRDAGGEYFQFYSQNYGEGFFFEIVQRVGGYKGYGAPNAPFRIAAQQRQIKSGAM